MLKHYVCLLKSNKSADVLRFFFSQFSGLEIWVNLVFSDSKDVNTKYNKVILFSTNSEDSLTLSADHEGCCLTFSVFLSSCAE